MKTSLQTPLLALAASAMLAACAPDKAPPEAPRPVRAVELRYDRVSDGNRYVGTVQARHEVDQAFRVGGKITERRVDVGQTVREGDVLAVLDDVDYRLAEEATHQELIAATAQAGQAESDRRRLEALKKDGSVSVADDEHARSNAEKARAAAEAAAKKLELARNRLKYTVLRASRSGVITQVRFENGQVVAEGQPGVSIADQGEPEIVVDVPEDHLATFKSARFKASLATAPDQVFDVVLRELAAQAAPQTRTYRARLKPATPRTLPLGATATLAVTHAAAGAPVASIPASAITQSKGQPALWIVRRTDSQPAGTAELVPVVVHGYLNEEVLVSGPPAGAFVVTAGVQKMAPGLRVALPDAPQRENMKEAAR